MSSPSSSAPSPLDPQVAELLARYAAKPGAFDELHMSDGAINPSWQRVLDSFATMSEAERAAARDKAQRLLSDNGVTFVAQGDEAQDSRPWKLDLFPMLIAPEEWRALEQGLIQRTRLLNEILADLYGSQRALREDKLPASVVFGNPRFLRPCSGLPARDGTYLHFLGFDVGRSPDGRWWVLSDRTEAPSGAGYALENRVVSSQSLPTLFANEHVLRQASFFRAFSEHFLALAERDDPVAVFLSRGPSKRNFFEHAYLARYLGYEVVEGSDLTVRDERLFLKTVQGLKQVDLVLRSVRSEMCDPLELRGDSLIGVPGLLQAQRAERVVIGNALGSGLVESDAFLSFLPALSRFYLGEDLRLPSLATWWCGQAQERDYVLANLDALTIRRISSTRSLLSGGQDGRVSDAPSPNLRDDLLREIQERGYDFVGQEKLTLSTAPVWSGDNALEAAPVVLRLYVAVTADGYQVMPGGLTRVSIDSNPLTDWLASGDVSKDTWALSDRPVETFSLLAQREQQVQLRRGGKDLPSRAADHLFWLGRYAERADATVRLLRSLVVRLHGEMGGSRMLVTPERIVALLVARKHMSARRGKRAASAGRSAVEQELWSIMFDLESKDGLATVLGNVRRTADVVRERLSFDTFRILKDLSEVVQASNHGTHHDTEEALRLLNRLIQYLAAFGGMVMENMTQGYGWRFLDMGRRLERVRTLSQLTQQLAVRGKPNEDGALDLLLELADSTMTYRSRYRAAPQLPGVLDLLFCDEANPRSAVFQITTVDEHLRLLPEDPAALPMAPHLRLTTRLATDLKLADVVKLSAFGSRFVSRHDLDRLLKQLENGTTRLSDDIARQFFSHSAPTRVSGSQGGL